MSQSVIFCVGFVLWWGFLVVSVLVLFVEMHRVAGRVFPSPDLLTHTNTHANTHTHTHTPEADWESAPAEKLWPPLYLLPEDFLSTEWYVWPLHVLRSLKVFSLCMLLRRLT